MELEGEDLNIRGFGFKPCWSWSDSSNEQSKLGIRHCQGVTFEVALRYMSIGKFSCALYIYGLLHCPPYLSISTTAESCHANMTLTISTDLNETHWSPPRLLTIKLFHQLRDRYSRWFPLTGQFNVNKWLKWYLMIANKYDLNVVLKLIQVTLTYIYFMVN